MDNIMVINGVTYVRQDTPLVPNIVDCDGIKLEVGDRVYVRQSALATYSMPYSDRDGGFAGKLNDDRLEVEFDNGYSFAFPAKHIRRNVDQD